VKNDDQGTVTMVLQGDEENVNAVVNSVRDGPQLSTVKAVEEASIDNPSSYDEFTIRR
jgi:acylphosphatase